MLFLGLFENFIAKCDTHTTKEFDEFTNNYYKVWQEILQSMPGITKWNRIYHKVWEVLKSVTRGYYKEWQLLQSET